MKSAATRNAPVPPGVCTPAARLSEIIEFPEPSKQLDRKSIELSQAGDGQIAFGILLFEQPLLCLLDRAQNRCHTRLTLVDAHAQIDLVWVRVFDECFRQTKDRIRGSRFELTKHEKPL